MPSLVSALTDVRGPGSGGQQPRKLSVLVAANRADVEVQPEQAGRGRSMGLEHDRGLQAAETGTDRSDLDAVGVPGELGVTEDLAPVPGSSGTRFQADDLIGRPDPEVFEKLGLALGPGDELVQPGRFEPLVGICENPQRTPARGLALHAEPQQFQLFQAAER